MKLLNVLCYIGLVTSVIAMAFVLVNWLSYMKTRVGSDLRSVQPGFPTKSVGFFLISALITAVLASSLGSYARRDALNFLQNLSGGYQVYVNEQEARDPDKMISSLKQVAPYWAHHSHPTKRIRVDIRTAARDLTLELGRDSDNPQEYWVFYVDDGIASQNEIGRITTPAFDAY